MKRVQILILILLLSPCAVQAKDIIDSLEQVIENNLTLDTNRVNLLNQLGYEYWIVDPNQSDKYGRQALELSKVLNFESGKAFAERVIGVAHWARGNYELALEHLFESLKRYKKLKDILGEANSTMNIGLVYGDQKNNKQALNYYNEALHLFEQLRQDSRIATTYTKIGVVYGQQKEYDKAYEYFSKAEKIHETNNFKYGMAEVNRYLGDLFIDKGDLDKGLSYLFRSLEASEGANDQHGLAESYQKIGRTYLKKKDWNLTSVFLNRSLEIAKNLGIKKTLQANFLDLKNLAKAQKNYPAAMNYFEQYVSISDSIFNEEKATQMANLQVQHATDSQEQELTIKQQEIALLEESKKSSKLLRWLTLVLLGVVGYFVFRYFKFQQDRIKRNKEKLLSEQANHQAAQKKAATALDIAKATNEQLREQLEIKNKELTSYTLNFIRKNELMEDFKNTINEIKKTANGSINSKLNSLQRQLDTALNMDKDWEDFRVHFEQVHSNFFTNLKANFSDLSGNDLKLCALLRLNLSSKEIATMLGISPDSVKTARYRLRKKLALEREENLLDFLTRLDNSSIA